MLLRHGPAPRSMQTLLPRAGVQCGVVAGLGVWESGAPSEINSTLPAPLTLPTIQGRLVLCYPTRVALNMLCDGYLLFYSMLLANQTYFIYPNLNTAVSNLSRYEMYECLTYAKCQF